MAPLRSGTRRRLCLVEASTAAGMGGGGGPRRGRGRGGAGREVVRRHLRGRQRVRGVQSRAPAVAVLASGGFAARGALRRRVDGPGGRARAVGLPAGAVRREQQTARGDALFTRSWTPAGGGDWGREQWLLQRRRRGGCLHLRAAPAPATTRTGGRQRATTQRAVRAPAPCPIQAPVAYGRAERRGIQRRRAVRAPAPCPFPAVPCPFPAALAPAPTSSRGGQMFDEMSKRG